MTSPSVSGKHIIGVSEAIAARQGTMGQFLFIGLPGKGQAVDGRLLLSFGSERTTACTAVGCVFSRNVPLSVTSNYWTSTRESDKELQALEKMHAPRKNSARLHLAHQHRHSYYKWSLSATRPEDLSTIILINPSKWWLETKSPKLYMK